MAENNSSAPLKTAEDVTVPAFHQIAKLKLDDLLARGYQITGYSIEMPLEGSQPSRGFINSGGFVGWWIDNTTHAVEAQAAPAAVAVPDDFELRERWRAAGGSFHGPCVETGTMPEAQLLPFLRDLAATPALPATEDSSAGDLVDVPRSVFLVTQHHAADGNLRTVYGHTLFDVVSVHSTDEQAQAARSAAEEAYHDEFPGYRQHGTHPMRLWAVQRMNISPNTAPQAQPADALDTERLDWILRQGDEFSCYVIQDAPGDGDYWVTGMKSSGQHKDPRAAIDAAMAAAQEGGDAAKEA